ncbi:site-specific integrase [Variovorax sp. J22G73]|uniref:site-specific integrase n=1 Tax=unclassified Variovorax TaxID=663243 RepID=UPI002574D790|nr:MULTISPECIES: site-specific integrase [unclassified Variovorax]MDM0010120.1 site-specific integrase [Variovorax sp. J22R203]MDM0103021.1 site-specific integrase [Variovorax sp. J22G73]
MPLELIELAPPPVGVALEMLDPRRLSHATEDAARELVRQGTSANTLASYQAAMRYWAAWFNVRYARALSLPVEVPVVVQFIVDHASREVPSEEGRDAVTADEVGALALPDAERPDARPDVDPLDVASSETGTAAAARAKGKKPVLAIGLPAEIDRYLVDGGSKGKLGAFSLNTLVHRVAVLSKAHQNLDLDNPCDHAQVRELLKSVRRAYAARNVRPHKQQALAKDDLLKVLETCDASPRGLRDRALLLFAFSSGGRRRSEIAGAVMDNLRKVSKGYTYSLGQSKTNQDGTHDDEKPIKGLAAAALDAWLAVAKVTEGPIFRRVLKGGKVTGDALDPKAVRKIVQARCLQAGLRGDFSAHSLRSGFVTEAGRQKSPMADAMKMTGHRNFDTFMGYYRIGDLMDSEAGDLME